MQCLVETLEPLQWYYGSDNLDTRHCCILNYFQCDYKPPTRACKEWKMYPVSVVFFMQVAIAWQGDDVEDHEESDSARLHFLVQVEFKEAPFAPL